MKKIVLAMCLMTSAFLLSSCYSIPESDAKVLADQLVAYIEQGEYDSASAFFCSDNDNGKSFSEFLDETEEKTTLDLQSGMAIKQYVDYSATHSDSYFGKPCAELEMEGVVDGQPVGLEVGLVETAGECKCFSFIVEYNGESYQYLCHCIDK